jgi:hypothetical protein
MFSDANAKQALSRRTVVWAMQLVCRISMTVLGDCSNVKLACSVLGLGDMRQGLVDAKHWSIDDAWAGKVRE